MLHGEEVRFEGASMGDSELRSRSSQKARNAGRNQTHAALALCPEVASPGMVG